MRSCFTAWDGSSNYISLKFSTSTTLVLLYV
nr:MAG TPA: hypothetical protein [Herelleviridae sp.]